MSLLFNIVSRFVIAFLPRSSIFLNFMPAVTICNDFNISYIFNLEKEMATHSSVLAWRTPGMGSLVGCCRWGRTESDMTNYIEVLIFGSSKHIKFSCSSFIVDLWINGFVFRKQENFELIFLKVFDFSAKFHVWFQQVRIPLIFSCCILYGTIINRVGGGQGSLACCSPWGRKELDTTEWLNGTDK